jgi:LacI family transcriptional regulator
MKELLPANPDAVFAASDAMAYGAIKAIQEAGLKIPEDIAVVGFDDLPGKGDSQTAFQLTTIHQPVLNFGMKAVEMLIDLIENGRLPEEKIIINAELIIRDTCGASRKQD